MNHDAVRTLTTACQAVDRAAGELPEAAPQSLRQELIAAQIKLQRLLAAVTKLAVDEAD